MINTGLKANFDKTVIYQVGNLNNRPKLSITKKFQWKIRKIDTVGVIANIEDTKQLEMDNFVQLLTK